MCIRDRFKEAFDQGVPERRMPVQEQGFSAYGPPASGAWPSSAPEWNNWESETGYEQVSRRHRGRRKPGAGNWVGWHDEWPN
eukprot:5902986-Alexandrium_andersonii.AAC.1